MGEAISLCVDSDQAAGRIYHVANHLSLTETEWVERIGRAAGWGGKVTPVPEEQLPESLRQDYDSNQE